MVKKAADDALFRLPAGRRGRVERAVDEAVRAARRDKRIDAMDAALVTLARAQARTVDLAESARDGWLLARVGGELRETLVRLRLDPTSRGVNRDALAEFLSNLGQPAPTDAASTATMGYAADTGPTDVRSPGHADDASAGLATDAVAETDGERRV